MNPLSNLIARLKANKVMTTSGLLIIACGLILAFPSLTSWLPPDIGKTLWNGAHDYILLVVGGAVLFAKGHATTGDPADAKSVEGAMRGTQPPSLGIAMEPTTHVQSIIKKL